MESLRGISGTLRSMERRFTAPEPILLYVYYVVAVIRFSYSRFRTQPFDPFYARMTTEQVRWVLESAVLSGQNMVCLSSFRPSFILTGTI